MPRFVVLLHDHPFPHWDLMLEAEGVLRTWRLLVEPVDVDEPVPAEPLPDHRIAYLDYEGPVSGDRGHVERWDTGSLAWVDVAAPLFELSGERLIGRFTIDGADDDYRLRRVDSEPDDA